MLVRIVLFAEDGLSSIVELIASKMAQSRAMFCSFCRVHMVVDGVMHPSWRTCTHSTNALSSVQMGALALVNGSR
jgi:hypothetical protein